MHPTFRNRSFRLGAAAVAAAVGLGATSAGAQETPTATGCPAAYERLAVASFGPPYALPELVDAGGNNNGYVCAFPLPDAARDATCRAFAGPACELKKLGLPMYQFTDDDNPSAS